MVEHLNAATSEIPVNQVGIFQKKQAPDVLESAWRLCPLKMVENFRGGEVYSIMLHAGGEKSAERFYSER
jgi:hypothetical protein